MNFQEAAKVKIPEILPVLPIKGGVVFPNLVVPLVLTNERSKKLIDDALSRDKLIAAVTQKDESVELPGPGELYEIGTASLVLKLLRAPDGSVRVLVQGTGRIRIVEYVQEEPYLKARVEELQETVEEGIELEALQRNVLNMFQEIVKHSPFLHEDLAEIALNIGDSGKLADFIASYMNFSVEEKQEILETTDVIARLRKLVRLLEKELEIIRVSEKIREEVKEEVEKGQREYFLREQLKAIQRELGMLDERTAEIEELKKKIEAAGMPEEVRAVAEKELERLSRIPVGSPEYTVSRTYLDWLVELPWSKETEDNLDIRRARRILDEDHYDLERVKERIIEFLAVRKLKKDSRGPILCFVGPPGVGKTSLGKSIARALGRKFVRIALGGVRDEAEIRGHRRTYVGALPGRIIRALRDAGTRNPVFMLDEVDKIGLDFRGDPASALLEVLDPEQNHAFSDHYLEVPFDLSHVLFITTANVTATIPPPLLDRMEVIEIPGYVEDDKVQIAKGYLIPRQIKANGLEGLRIVFQEAAIRRIIRDYTREAGVRNLERKIAAVLRKIAVKVAEGELGDHRRIVITPRSVEEYLGPPEYFAEVAARKGEVGVVTGLAWTPAGGDILFIEALKMPGKGRLFLTGHLGQVMKESAETALSLVRSKVEELGLPPDFHEKCDLHIHVPAGAIPKDGPSAGVAIFTALVSLLTGIPVPPTVAMTGEITLRGKVMPVGGIKEKVVAAKRAGITRVILPRWNRKDLIEVPERVKEGLKFHFVDHVDQVLRLTIGRKLKRQKRMRRETVEVGV